MKKIIFLLLLSTTACFPQVEFGAKAGATFSKFTGYVPGFEEYYEYKPGFYAGGFVNVGLGDNFDAQADVLFSKTGTKFNYDYEPYTFERTVTDCSIIVPAVLRYNLFDFYAEAGGQAKFGLSREYEYGEYEPRSIFYGDQNDGTDIVFGIAFGIGYNITDHFSIGGRYFIESNKKDERKEIARVFSFGAGYSF